MSNPPQKADDETPVEYAKRLVEAGYADERVRYQMSLAAGTIDEMEKRAPAGTSLQTLTRVMIGQAIFTEAPASKLEELADDVERAAEELSEISNAVGDIAEHGCVQPVVDAIEDRTSDNE